MPKRQLNVRFLCVLVAAAGVVAVTGHLLHGHQVKRNAGYLLAQSKRATAEKDVPTAVKYLVHYLTLRPDDARARARFGLILANHAKTRREKVQAYLTLDRALQDDRNLEKTSRDDPELALERKDENKEVAALAEDLTRVRRRAAELAMEISQYADARTHLDALLKESPGDAELLVLLGRCEEDAGRAAEAAKAYSGAIKAEPSRVDAYAHLAALYRRTDKAGEADQVMANLVEKNPGSVRARLAAVKYYRIHGQFDTARKNLAAAQTDETRGDKEVLLAGIDLALAEPNEAEAREKLQLGLKSYPAEPQFYLVLAGLELRSGKRAEAVKLLKDVVKVLPKLSDEVWAVADLLIDADEPKQARELVNRLRDEKADPAALDFLEARLHLAGGEAREAEDLLRRCRTAFARKAALAPLAVRTELLLAACYDRLGKPDLRLKAAQQAGKIDPASVSARMALAAALLAAGNADEALGIYRPLIARDPSVRLTVARVVIWQNRRRPADQRNLFPAAEVLDAAPQGLKDTADYLLVRAELLVAEAETLPAPERKKRLDVARQAIEAARNKYPKEPRFWVFLAQLAAVTSPADGLAILDLARAEAGDQVMFRLARVALAGPKLDPATLRAFEPGAERFSPAERSQLFQGLAAAHLRAGSAADAERLLRQLAAEHPGDLDLLTRLFEVVAAKEKPEEVAPFIDQLRQAEGEDGSVWRFADAFHSWLVCRKDLAPAPLRHAQIRLAEAAKLRKEWFRVPLLEGEIEDRAGHPDEAIEKYLKAIRLGARQPAVVTRATTLLMARGRHDEVRQLIDEARRRSPEAVPELARIDAVNLVQLGEGPDQVLARMEQAAPAKSTDPRDHLFRGALFASLDKPKDAEAAYRRAIELKPAEPEGWVALVRLLAREKREADAKQELANAAKALPADNKARALAPCYEALGDRAEAEKYYTQALREAPADTTALRGLATFYVGGGEAAKAEPILRQLLIGSDETARWARRTLALTLATSGDYARGTNALSLLEENLRANPGAPEDLRVRSLILATRPGGRGQSIKDLEAAFARVHPGPAEEFLLAQLYELDGDWPKANDRLLGLLSRRGGDVPAYLAYYVRALLRHNDLPGAVKWLARLEAREKRDATPDAKGKDSPRVVELQARVWAAQGQRAKAADRLKTFAAGQYKEQNNPLVLRAVGVLMAELQLTTEAEELLRQYVAAAEMKTPAAVLVLADFLARHDRVGEALAICSAALAKVNPEVVARLTVSVARVGQANDAQFAEAEAILRRAAGAKPESVDIRVSMADLRDAQGRYDEAKQMYRDIIARDSRSTLAMNNLAWLLALHEGNYPEARRQIDRAIEVRGPDGNLLDTRGVILMLSGDTAAAVADLTTAVARDPLPERYFHLAQAYQKAGAGSRIDASRALRKARDLDLSKTKNLHRLEWASYDALIGQLGGN